MRQNTPTLVAVLLILAAGAALAADESPIQLQAVAEVEIEVTNEAGETVVQRQEATKVVPGDEVIYTINYTNVGHDSVADVVITNPVPAHMACRRIVDGDTGVHITMSVDGGRQYATAGELTMVGPSGSERPAQPSDYTHIRWAFPRPVAPGDAGSVAFRARLL